MNSNNFQIKIFNSESNNWEEVEVYNFDGSWKLLNNNIFQKGELEEIWNLPQVIIDNLTLYYNNLGKSNNFRLAWWSDFQTNNESLNYKVEELDFLDKKLDLDLRVMGGDMIDGFTNSKVRAANMLRDMVNKALISPNSLLFSLMGNHDTNFYAYNHSITNMQNKENLITPSEFHDLTLKHLEGEVVFDTENPKGGYYYKDFLEHKIRVIVLNTSDYFDDNEFPLAYPLYVDVRQKQFSWFSSVALNFMDKVDRNEWGIIVLSHAALMPASGEVKGSLTSPYEDGFSYQNGLQFRGVLKAFKNGTDFSMTSNLGGDWEIQSNVDFSNQGPIEVIANIHGHAHLDRVWMYEGIPTIGIICCNPLTRRESYPTEDESIYVATSAYRGNVSESPTKYTDPYPTLELINAAFDVFEIDRTNRLIIAKRFGAGKDRIISYG